jgi:hypothetical protein
MFSNAAAATNACHRAKLFLRHRSIHCLRYCTYTVRAVSIVIYRYTCHHTRPSRKLEVTATLLFDTHNQSCRTPGVPPLDISTKYGGIYRQYEVLGPRDRPISASSLQLLATPPSHQILSQCHAVIAPSRRPRMHYCTGSLTWARGDADYKSKVSTRPASPQSPMALPDSYSKGQPQA